MFIQIIREKVSLQQSCNELEAVVQEDIVTQASLTAKAFFEKRGYVVMKAQEVVREGISLTNYIMIKKR